MISPPDLLWRLNTDSLVTFLQMMNVDGNKRVDRASLKVQTHFLRIFMALLRGQYNMIRFYTASRNIIVVV